MLLGVAEREDVAQSRAGSEFMPYRHLGFMLRHEPQVASHTKLLFPAEPERDLPTKMERILRISAELMYFGHSGTENAKKQSYST